MKVSDCYLPWSDTLILDVLLKSLWDKGTERYTCAYKEKGVVPRAIYSVFLRKFIGLVEQNR